ncbi:substrate-binding domain-containing protein [Phormidium sp. CCY1219]|uniref:substrate-binding domain-containing protein n=1 Tax=Phormidium sp. CCY1219 TaxID=2886104 RepID=UPI002D1E579E|nr:substrate-binding domain-containing protein [Phormidium sp. CCY1219]MEB3826367.1 substrate-binding domain-containing protein [Phormidium sp. CCY1219]
MSKKLGKEVLKEAGRREAARAATKASGVKRGFTAGLTRLVPMRMRWMVPFVKQHLKISPPKLPQFKSKLPFKLFKKETEAAEETQLAPELEAEPTPVQLRQPIKPLYPKYSCLRANPLACEVPQQTQEERPKAKFCRECGFPVPLPMETQIQGSRGTYQVERLLGYRNMGRLYEGIKLSDRQPVVIKEYLFPKRYFNKEETRQRRELFLLFSRVSLADGRVQDPRLLTPTEAIASPLENRCYLITQGKIDSFPTLASYLLQTGPLSSFQVYQALDQVLQSLQFLHGQKFRLHSGLVKPGIAHGNLSLDSLLIVPHLQGFFIYLCDLGLWENPFHPILPESVNLSPERDLKDLGYIAFYLLAGSAVDLETERPLNPTVEEDWPPVNRDLKNFILNLIGIGNLPFHSAENARQTLLKLPISAGEIQSSLANKSAPNELITEPISEKKKPWRRILGVSLGILGVVLLGLLIYWLVTRKETRATDEQTQCCIENVAGIPLGDFIYTTVESGIWNYVLDQPNLIARGKTLESELRLRISPPGEEGEPAPISFRAQEEPSATEAIAQVLSQSADFAIANLLSAKAVYGDLFYTELGYEAFAYDGIVVFVPFSYARRENSLPHELNGTITFEQLRQIYTGEITNWSQLGGPDLEIKLYVPVEEEAVRMFESRVLKDRGAIAQFRALRQNQTQPGSFAVTPARITSLSTFAMLRQVIRDFEDNTIGSIGFGSLSKVFGQCSVYPLAIARDNSSPISPLIHPQLNQPITPDSDLCNDKGSYFPNAEAFRNNRYPLAYPLSIIYLRDNRLEPVGEKFAEILKTTEAQRLIYQTGLIPLNPLPPR